MVGGVSVALRVAAIDLHHGGDLAARFEQRYQPR